MAWPLLVKSSNEGVIGVHTNWSEAAKNDFQANLTQMINFTPSLSLFSVSNLPKLILFYLAVVYLYLGTSGFFTKMGHFRQFFFILVFSIQIIANKTCQRLDSNRGSLVCEATGSTNCATITTHLVPTSVCPPICSTLLHQNVVCLTALY